MINAALLTTGTLPAGRMPALTGDVTTSAGTVATTIANNAVTNAKAAQAGANTMKGNWTGSTANVSVNTMPSCADTGGNHLNYVNGTGVTCGTSGGGSGSMQMIPFATAPLAANTTNYGTPGQLGGTNANATIPLSGTFKNLYISIQTAANTNTPVFTLYTGSTQEAGL